MRFLIDENVRTEVSDFLSTVGDTVGVSPGATDTEVAKVARTESRVIVTHDKDFANPHSFPPHDYAGIIVIRIHPPRPDAIIAALSALFKDMSGARMAGTLVILEKTRFLLYPGGES
jgi:predicted nuclease of predicted toxin-antitoxin system